MMPNLEPFYIIFSGPAESPAIREQIKNFSLRHKRILLVCNERLITVAALLSLCGLYVGNDSGVSHLAAAVNDNVVVLYGPTDPFLWRPVGPKVMSISALAPHSSLLSITVNEVYETLMAYRFGARKRA
jgi:ADP-heptose:LPS heptosyltransferase